MKVYFVRGCTALLDAVGGAIHHIGNIHKYARDEDRPEKTLFIITTDGMENASRRYTYAKVKKMVERQKDKYGWEFLFLGANMDAIEAAGNIGIRADRAVTYQCDEEGTALNYEVMDDAKIRLIGFGTFKKQHRDARKGRNPQTGAEMEIAASDSLSFKSNMKY